MDSSALLALLYQESGQLEVASHLNACCMSTVNLAEVLGRFRRDGKDAGALLSQLERSDIEFVPLDAGTACESSELLPLVQTLGLSLGDRICLALARRRRLPVLTADRQWARLDLGIEIRQIRS